MSQCWCGSSLAVQGSVLLTKDPMAAACEAHVQHDHAVNAAVLETT